MIKYIKTHKLIIASVWGFITTCVSLYLSIWPIEQNPELTIYQEEKFDAFTVETPIDEIQILLNGIDVRKSDYNLKVYKLKIINEGKKDIRDYDYSKEMPFGIRINQGKVLRLNVENSNKSILARNLISTYNKDSSFINFNKIFIGKSEKIDLDIWVLHKKDKEPGISASGQIADTGVKLSTQKESEKTGWADLWVFLCICAGGALAIYAIKFVSWFSSFISRSVAQKRRSIIIKQLWDYRYNSSDVTHKVIHKIFCSLKKKDFIKNINVLLDSEQAYILYEEEQKSDETVEAYNKLVVEKKVEDEYEVSEYESQFLDIIKLCEEAELIEIKDNEIILSNHLKTELEFILQLLAEES